MKRLNINCVIVQYVNIRIIKIRTLKYNVNITRLKMFCYVLHNLYCNRTISETQQINDLIN